MRPDWHQYFMGIVFMAAKRSSCEYVNAGAVLVKDRNIIATGYNGSPAGTTHCMVKGCQKKKLADAGFEAVCLGIHQARNQHGRRCAVCDACARVRVGEDAHQRRNPGHLLYGWGRL